MGKVKMKSSDTRELVFTVDHAFESASTAATLVTGCPSAPTVWRPVSRVLAPLPPPVCERAPSRVSPDAYVQLPLFDLEA